MRLHTEAVFVCILESPGFSHGEYVNLRKILDLHKNRSKIALERFFFFSDKSIDCDHENGSRDEYHGFSAQFYSLGSLQQMRHQF